MFFTARYTPGSQQTECAGAVIHQKWHAAVHTHPGDKYVRGDSDPGTVEETHSACRIFFPASGNVRLNANRMIFESVILFFHHK
ncbi:Uncharacterised protein [Escherichia coli]|uniref:Uncharacterized protein n=1 Tax=Escherichia coli TaxID=562 RepID=A0A376VDX2_ECOLX|nr:Uncharacterised protein [Escherichia coli]